MITFYDFQCVNFNPSVIFVFQKDFQPLLDIFVVEFFDFWCWEKIFKVHVVDSWWWYRDASFNVSCPVSFANSEVKFFGVFGWDDQVNQGIHRITNDYSPHFRQSQRLLTDPILALLPINQKRIKQPLLILPSTPRIQPNKLIKIQIQWINLGQLFNPDKQ